MFHAATLRVLIASFSIARFVMPVLCAAPRRARAFIYTGMPSNTVDLEAFERFIFACASDQRFNAPTHSAEMEGIGGKYDFINRSIMRYLRHSFHA